MPSTRAGSVRRLLATSSGVVSPRRAARTERSYQPAARAQPPFICSTRTRRPPPPTAWSRAAPAWSNTAAPHERSRRARGRTRGALVLDTTETGSGGPPGHAARAEPSPNPMAPGEHSRSPDDVGDAVRSSQGARAEPPSDWAARTELPPSLDRFGSGAPLQPHRVRTEPRSSSTARAEPSPRLDRCGRPCSAPATPRATEPRYGQRHEASPRPGSTDAGGRAPPQLHRANEASVRPNGTNGAPAQPDNCGLRQCTRTTPRTNGAQSTCTTRTEPPPSPTTAGCGGGRRTGDANAALARTGGTS